MSKQGSRRNGRSSARPRGAAPTVAALYAALDAIAPFAHAESWDNVGLIAGRSDWPAGRVLLALDLTDAVADEALHGAADVVLTYHPPIFKGTKTVTPTAEGPTARLPDLLAAKVSLLSPHTAMDNAVCGTNDVLLDAFELSERYPLSVAIDETREYKLVVFVPPAETARLRAALSAAGAGVIGAYTECSYELGGRGTFRGDESTNPAVGKKLQFETCDETRLEMIVPRSRVGPVVRALYATHSYEEPAFDLYPLQSLRGRGGVGLGRVGALKRPQRGKALLGRLESGGVDTSAAQVVGSLARSFERVIAAAGSFGERSFRDPGALVITGELKHHEALQLLRRGVTAICLGHWASERPLLESLRERLAAALPSAKVALARADRSPFTPRVAIR